MHIVTGQMGFSVVIPGSMQHFALHLDQRVRAWRNSCLVSAADTAIRGDPDTCETYPTQERCVLMTKHVQHCRQFSKGRCTCAVAWMVSVSFMG